MLSSARIVDLSETRKSQTEISTENCRDRVRLKAEARVRGLSLRVATWTLNRLMWDLLLGCPQRALSPSIRIWHETQEMERVKRHFLSVRVSVCLSVCMYAGR